MVLIAPFLATAAAAEAIAPYFPTDLNPSERFRSPSAEHILGTDMLGRNTLRPVIYGSRLSLSAGVVSVALAIGLRGNGGRGRRVLRRMDRRAGDALFGVCQAFPSILVALLVVVALPPGWTAVIIYCRGADPTCRCSASRCVRP